MSIQPGRTGVIVADCGREEAAPEKSNGRAGILRSGCFHDVANDILLVEKGGVLTITQDGRSYLALRWKLTDEVVSVVRTAIGFGLSKLWQAGHPKGRQSSHISFSRTREPASWVFALGLEACPPRLQKITFNKRFLSIFEASDLDWTCRKAGGNIFIPPDRLAETLTLLRERLSHPAVPGCPGPGTAGGCVPHAPSSAIRRGEPATAQEAFLSPA